MTDDEKQDAAMENIAFRTAKKVSDDAIAQIKNETKMLADAVRQAALTEIEKAKMSIESARSERHAEIAHHADTCPVKAQMEETKATVSAYVNQGKGAGWMLLKIAAVLAFIIMAFLEVWRFTHGC